MKPSELPDPASWGAWVACDCETSGLHWDDHTWPEGSPVGVSVVSVAWIGKGGVEAYAWPFDQGVRDKLAQGQLLLGGGDPNLDEAEWHALLEWLARQQLVFHNAKFDLGHLRRGTRLWEGRELVDRFVWDTMLAQQVLDPGRSAALKPAAERLGLQGGGEQGAKDALKEAMKQAKLGKGIGIGTNPRYDLVDWDTMEPYAVQDAVLTIELAAHQLDRLETGEVDDAPVPVVRRRIQREFDLMTTLYQMERRGMAFDAQGCLQEAGKLVAMREALEEQLPFVPTLPAAKRYFFETAGVTPIKTTELGNPVLDDEVRAKLVEWGVQWAEEYDRHRELDVAISMWYHGWPAKIGDDGRLRMTFRQGEVKSGRMGAERVQLHAIPKDDKTIGGVAGVRSFFGARPGHVLWNLDLSQAELRIASQFADCTRMLEMLEAGADLHGVTTTEIFGITKGHPEWKVKRDIAKRLTFGGIFQIGARTFRATLSKLAGIEWSMEESETAIRRWRRLYPEFGYAYGRYSRQVEKEGRIQLIGNEWSYFGPRDYPQTGWNRKVQGSLAKFVKLWLPRVEAATAEWDALVMTVHDSTVLELPEVGIEDMVPEGEDGALVHPVAAQVARDGSEMATAMFGLRMPIDVGLWAK